MAKKSTSDELPLQAGPGILVHTAALLWQHQVESVVAEWDLTVTQFVLLWGVGFLTRNPEPLTQAQLARHVGTDVMLTSKHVRDLESKQLLERQPHPTDTRARSLVLTKQGQQVLKKAAKAVSKLDNRMFGKGTVPDKFTKLLGGVTRWSA